MTIDGHARSEGSILVTNNPREFDRIPGLQVENWVGGDACVLDLIVRPGEQVIVGHAFSV
jgi:hypothetical protein